jgi:hypothetical protein
MTWNSSNLEILPKKEKEMIKRVIENYPECIEIIKKREPCLFNHDLSYSSSLKTDFDCAIYLLYNVGMRRLMEKYYRKGYFNIFNEENNGKLRQTISFDEVYNYTFDKTRLKEYVKLNR